MRTYQEIAIAASVLGLLVFTVALAVGDGKARWGQRRQVHAALDEALASCPENRIAFHASIGNRGRSNFSAACEAAP